MAQQADQGSVAVACLECRAQRSCVDAPAGYSLLGLELGGVEPRALVEVYGQEDCAGPTGRLPLPRLRLGLPLRRSRRGLSPSAACLVFAAG